MLAPNLISEASAAPTISAIASWAPAMTASLRADVRNAPSVLAFDVR